MSDYSLLGPLWTLLADPHKNITNGETEIKHEAKVTVAKPWSRDSVPGLSDSKAMLFPLVLTRVLPKFCIKVQPNIHSADLT